MRTAYKHDDVKLNVLMSFTFFHLLPNTQDQNNIARSSGVLQDNVICVWPEAIS